MHERRFAGEIERLRTPERVALLEVDRVLNLCLDGIYVARVLDAGTGSGIFAEAFARRGFSVTGIDPNPEMLDAARRFVPSATFAQGTIEEIPFVDRSFDLVFLGHVLHESDDLARALREAKRTSKLRTAILEWPYREEEIGPPFHHRLNPSIVTKAAGEAGFARIETRVLIHMVLFILQ